MSRQLLGNIKGPRGDQGPKGEQGIRGAKGDQGDIGFGLPEGGTTGQILYKVTDTDYDTGWKDEN